MQKRNREDFVYKAVLSRFTTGERETNIIRNKTEITWNFNLEDKLKIFMAIKRLRHKNETTRNLIKNKETLIIMIQKNIIFFFFFFLISENISPNLESESFSPNFPQHHFCPNLGKKFLNVATMGLCTKFYDLYRLLVKFVLTSIFSSLV